MSRFRVETTDLKTSATMLEDKNSNYVAAYGKLYAEIAGLKVDWQGQSSEAFNNAVESYRSSFEELSRIVQAYIEFLRSAAANYEATEQAITEAANRLVN